MARRKAAKKKQPAKSKTTSSKATSKPASITKTAAKGTAKQVDEEYDAGNSSWEIEDIGLTLEKLRTKVTRHTSIQSTVGDENVNFQRGDKIWVAPEPGSSVLQGLKDKVDNLEDVPDELWDVAEIVDCCCLRHDDGTSLGFLRVKWFYQLEECLALPTLHAGFKKKLKEYKFDKDERVDTNHIDFVSLQAYGGSAEGIWCYVSISGLEVSDEDRLKPLKKRAAPKKKVTAQGFSLKAVAVSQERKEEMEKAAERMQADKLKRTNAKKATTKKAK